MRKMKKIENLSIKTVIPRLQRNLASRIVPGAGGKRQSKNFVYLGLQRYCNRESFMTKRLVRFLAIVLIAGVNLVLTRTAEAQDATFTQFYANPLYLNPAFAGTNKCPRVTLNYRNQWPALQGSFETFTAGYDQYVEPISGGIGVQFFHDNAGQGTLTTNSVSGMYSYQTPISESLSLTAGVQVTYFQKSLDWGKLTFGDEIDPRRGFVFETQDTQRGGEVSNVDFSAGALIYGETFYGGIAVHHLNEPNESLIVGTSRWPRKYTAHAGAVFPINKNVKGESETSISPNFMFQMQNLYDQGIDTSFTQYNIGLYVQKGPLVGGAWYRFNDSFIMLLGIELERIKFAYSYDLTTNELSTQTAGSHELSVALRFNCKPQKKKFKAISCPSF